LGERRRAFRNRRLVAAVLSALRRAALASARERPTWLRKNRAARAFLAAERSAFMTSASGRPESSPDNPRPSNTPAPRSAKARSACAAAILGRSRSVCIVPRPAAPLRRDRGSSPEFAIPDQALRGNKSSRRSSGSKRGNRRSSIRRTLWRCRSYSPAALNRSSCGAVLNSRTSARGGLHDGPKGRQHRSGRWCASGLERSDLADECTHEDALHVDAREPAHEHGRVPLQLGVGCEGGMKHGALAHAKLDCPTLFPAQVRVPPSPALSSWSADGARERLPQLLRGDTCPSAPPCPC
jgi:hypothetical protein